MVSNQHQSFPNDLGADKVRFDVIRKSVSQSDSKLLTLLEFFG